MFFQSKLVEKSGKLMKLFHFSADLLLVCFSLHTSQPLPFTLGPGRTPRPSCARAASSRRATATRACGTATGASPRCWWAAPREPARRSVCDQKCDLWSELWAARSQLYRSQILQLNTRWKALAEIYTMHSFAPFSNLKIFVKIAEFYAVFSKNFANCARTLLNFHQI